MKVDQETGEMKRKSLMIVSTITYVENAPENYEHPTGASLTVPDMAMSLQKIMTDYVQNSPIDTQQTVFFDQEFPDIRLMSKTDLLEAADQAKSELQTIQNEIDRKNQEELDKQNQEKLDKQKKDDADKQAAKEILEAQKIKEIVKS